MPPTFSSPPTEQEQNRAMRRYYRLQSKIYDATRWSFLFGRRSMIRDLPFSAQAPFRALEVGCGTGYNLVRIARHFPAASLTGLDVSADMIGRARCRTAPFGARIRLHGRPYTSGETGFAEKFDLILFSYALTMINPQWADLIEQAGHDLRPGGWIAVTDFHDSPLPWFKRHMAGHHVRMDGHLLPALEARFQTESARVRPAYGGIWSYLSYLGRKLI